MIGPRKYALLLLLKKIISDKLEFLVKYKKRIFKSEVTDHISIRIKKI